MRVIQSLICFIVLNLAYVYCVSVHQKIVIDNDAGGDDAMAIFIALLYEKYFDGPQMIGLITGNGNTKENNVYYNNQRILKVARRQDVYGEGKHSEETCTRIRSNTKACLKFAKPHWARVVDYGPFTIKVPIYRGSKNSLVITPAVNATYGQDGLGDSDEVVTGLIPAKETGAVMSLIEMSKKYEGELIVITIGALTNVALAFSLDPNFLSRLAHLYVGAGHIYSEINPLAETNAKNDAEAYSIIVKNSNPQKVTILPYSQTKESLNISKAWRENVLGAINTDIIKAQNIYERIGLTRSDWWTALDPATVAMALRPDLVDEYKYSRNDIVLCGDDRAIVTNDFVHEQEANIRIIYSAHKQKYMQFLLDVFTSENK